MLTATFDRFIVGPSNQRAHSTAVRVAKRLFDTPNPVAIHGPSGIGKTHLLRAIEHEARVDERLTVQRVTAAELSDRFCAAVRQNNAFSWQRDLELLDLLLLDDLDCLGRWPSLEGLLVTLLERLTTKGGQAVLAMRRPANAPAVQRWVRRGRRGGTIIEVSSADDEVARAFATREFRERGIDVAPEVTDYVIGLGVSLPEVQGAVALLSLESRMAAGPITLERAESALRHTAGADRTSAARLRICVAGALRDPLDVVRCDSSPRARPRTARTDNAPFVKLARSRVALLCGANPQRSAALLAIHESTIRAQTCLLVSTRLARLEVAGLLVAVEAGLQLSGDHEPMVRARDHLSVERTADRLRSAPLFVEGRDDIGLEVVAHQAVALSRRTDLPPLGLVVIDGGESFFEGDNDGQRVVRALRRVPAPVVVAASGPFHPGAAFAESVLVASASTDARAIELLELAAAPMTSPYGVPAEVSGEMLSISTDDSGAVLGWRLWDIVDTGSEVRLASPQRHTPWNRGVMQAQCPHRASHRVEAGCGCGIYAHAAPIEAATAWDAGSQALGLVRGWGRVQRHTRGWRAEFVQPLELYVAPSYRDASPQLGASYDLDVRVAPWHTVRLEDKENA